VEQLLQVLVIGVPTGVAYAAVALGFNVVFRAGKVFNIALGELFALAAFTMLWLINSGLAVWPAFVITLVAMAVTGVVVQRVLLHPLLGQPEMSLFMMTLGLLLILNGARTLTFDVPDGKFPALFGGGAIQLPYDISLPVSRAVGVVVVLVLVVVLMWFFNRTRTGLAMTAVAEDHEIAQSLGISIGRSLAISWGIAGALTALSAAIYLSGVTVTGDVGAVAFLALPVVLLGGLESIGGVALGGIVVGAGQTAAAIWLDPHFQGGASLIFPFLLMLVILLVRPQGLFGWKHVERA
jgi:branched-chain amino acid transport system permease protein